MRLHEFIELISEINMRPTALKNTAKPIPAWVGFEFEMFFPFDEIIPPATRKPLPKPDNVVECLPDVLDFFSNTDTADLDLSRQLRIVKETLMHEYQEWKFEILRSRWKTFGGRDIDHLTNDELENDPDWLYFQRLRSPAYSDDFFRERYPHMSDIYNAFPQQLTWPTYTPADQNKTQENAYKKIAEDFQKHTGYSVLVNSHYHGTAKRDYQDSFILEPDGSLKLGDDRLDGMSNDSHIGLELVSPKIPLANAPSLLNKIFKWCNLKNIRTTYQTGLHINVSIEDRDLSDLNYTKLVLLSGDQYVLEIFDRTYNKYCKNVTERLMTALDNRPVRTLVNMFDMAKNGLYQELADWMKYTAGPEDHDSINIKDKWIEFRSAGNDWLGAGQDIILATVHRYVVSMNAAFDEKLYAREFYKKMGSLLIQSSKNADPDSVSLFSAYASNIISKKKLYNELKIREKERERKKPKERSQEENDHYNYLLGRVN